MSIIIKNAKQIEGIRAASKIVALINKSVRESIKAGMTTYQVDNIAKHILREHNARSPFYKYKFASKSPFPGHVCISINNEIVHGIPQVNRVIQDGDLVKVDVGATLNNFIGDAAQSIIVGNVSDEIKKIVQVTEEVLDTAIQMTKHGTWLYDISAMIYNTAKQAGYGVVIAYTGHGVGLKLHEPPQIYNYVPPLGVGVNVKLQAGMIITYEPMFTLGRGDTRELFDGWTVVTQDNSIATHCEHTVLVKENSSEILTTL